ncbi:MAG: acetylglutamate kinase [Parvibaculum sp.]|uniref:acetylglutamate kinase n=1 Tax=Parvibaculum sp. TaxID=2024848 RepID=UPI0025FE8B92|nr:acetylglutamate kinase [Parvibaculum sp.]MCE9650990.1 acetylglutamate kinase [Parvibaculum sp.]
MERARVLSEALPFMQRYDKRTIVVKYGGHAMGDEALGAEFARDIVLLKQSGLNPIVVHGGGPQIGAMLTRLGIKSEFSGGLRITDKATVEIVEMVLAGSINKQIVAQLNQAGGRAIGLSGKDGNLIVARKVTQKIHDPESNIEKILDLGFVGEPESVNPEILKTIIASDIIPVIAPVGISKDGDTYNINADTAAGAIAAAMGATRLLLLTDVRGVLDKAGTLIEELTLDEATALMQDGTISGGMIPKVETCMDAVNGGVEAVVILDGRVRHAVLLELFTEHGVGTLIQKSAV